MPNSHPNPSQLVRGHYTFDACGTSLLQRAWWLLLAAAIPSPERPPSWIAMLLLWLLIAWLWKRHALHAAGLRQWANRLHVGDSRHLVMSPSEALAKLLIEDDHCFY